MGRPKGSRNKPKTTMPAEAAVPVGEVAATETPDQAEARIMAEPTCENCRFAVSRNIAGGIFYRCRRYPPTVAERYPRVFGNDWCGDWKARP